MGDYVVGYFDNPNLKLQIALAASAAVPAAIGPRKLGLPNSQRRQLPYRKPPGAERLANRRFVMLWDGGVYENLGVERLFRVGEFAPPIDFLITLPRIGAAFGSDWSVVYEISILSTAIALS